MAGGTKSRKKHQPIMSAETYQHPYADSPMRPEVGVQREFRKKRAPRTYCYDSSLAPALDWDGQNPARELGEWLLALIEEAAGLEPPHVFPSPREFHNGRDRIRVSGLHEAVAMLQRLGRPFLNWAGKAERLSFDVPTLPLFVHERLSTKAIFGRSRAISATTDRARCTCATCSATRTIRSPTRCCAPTSTATTGSTA